MEFEISTDVFGKSVSDLYEKKLFLLDMDGTIYSENTLFDGALQLMQAIEELGGVYVFITNNSSKSVSDYIEKLNHMGIPAAEKNFFTSTQASILYLEQKYPGAKVYCQGTRSFVNELKNAGIKTTEAVEEDVDVVLVGFDTEISGEKLRNTSELLTRGLPFIAANPDIRCPVDFGYIPDCGSICQMLTNATGSTPVFIGKPEAAMIDKVREKLGYTRNETVVVGDRLYTDIAAGKNAKVTSVCVLSGEASKEDIVNSSIKPDLTFENIKTIYQILAHMDKM